MATGPSPINGSAAGIPLSRMTAETSGRQTRTRTQSNEHGIADTFETSDREGDGRSPLDRSTQEAPSRTEPGGQDAGENNVHKNRAGDPGLEKGGTIDLSG